MQEEGYGHPVNAGIPDPPPAYEEGYGHPVHAGVPDPPPSYDKGGYYSPPAPGAMDTQNGTTVYTVQGRVMYKPKDYLLLNFLGCMCCFCPTGMFAIYMSSKVQDAIQRNDMATAEYYSQLAKRWGYITLIIGVATTIIGCVLTAVLTERDREKH